MKTSYGIPAAAVLTLGVLLMAGVLKGMPSAHPPMRATAGVVAPTSPPFSPPPCPQAAPKTCTSKLASTPLPGVLTGAFAHGPIRTHAGAIALLKYLYPSSQDHIQTAVAKLTTYGELRQIDPALQKGSFDIPDSEAVWAVGEGSCQNSRKWRRSEFN